MSDGGEGFLECFTGERHVVALKGPLGRLIEVPFVLHEQHQRRIAIAESAHAIGRFLVPDPSSAAAITLSSAPIGHLLLHLQTLDVQGIQLGIGGTATSDGGRGAATVLLSDGGLKVDLQIAVDIDLPYARAIDFALQKGISAEDLPMLARKLEATRRWLHATTSVDPGPLVGAGAGGGVGGITGEGRLDHTSFEGKVIGWLLEHVGHEIPVAIVCGEATPDALEHVARLDRPITVLDLSARFGSEQSLTRPKEVATDAVRSLLESGGLG